MNFPKTRNNCFKGERPCVWVRCSHHMLWAMNPGMRQDSRKVIYRKFLDSRTDEEFVDIIFRLSETCMLDITDRGGQTLESIGEILGITRERVRQIEISKKGGAIRRLRHLSKSWMLEEFKRDSYGVGDHEHFVPELGVIAREWREK